MKTYTPIVFLHDYQDEIVKDYLAGDIGESELIDYLTGWDYGEGEEKPEPSHGTSDTTLELSGYILSVNFGLGYVGLDRINAE